MQAVQLDQLLPQVQTLEKTPQDLKTGDNSFMEMIREARFESSEEIENVEEPETAKRIEEPEEKIASVKSPESEKVENSEYLLAAYIHKPAEEVSLSQVVEFDPEQLALDEMVLSEEVTPKTLSEEQINWLYEPMSKASVSEDFTDEEFAQLIDAAVEFIPGEMSEDEKLEKAQNLAAKDPAMFLAKVNADSISQIQENEKSLKIQDLSVKEKSSIPVKSEKKSNPIEVSDLRTVKTESKSAEIPVTKVQSKKDFNISYKRESENSLQVTMDLANAIKQDVTASSSQAAGANGSTFQSMLSNAVQENAPDFVKAGTIVLKDNKQGSINLVLHPEKLGNVKISLSLSDKFITGQITVHSQEAYDAMKESIAALKAEFASNGFETGDFNLSFASQQGFAQSSENSQGQNQQSSYMANKAYGEYVAVTSDEAVEAAYNNYGNYSVNIVA